MCFIDAQGRTITIVSDYDVSAYHDGRQIGSIEFDEHNGFPRLFAMNVDAAYQKAGIGTEMMKCAAEIHGTRFGKPSELAVGGLHANSDSYYTPEGLALVRRCIREGILEDTEPSDHEDYDD